jgi:hypothetical protein
MESVETGRLGGLARASSCSPTGRPLPFSSETRFVFGKGISWLVGGDLQRAESATERALAIASLDPTRALAPSMASMRRSGPRSRR